MAKLKEFISLLVIVLVTVYFSLNYKNIITTFKSFFEEPKVIILDGNEYTKNKNYLFVQHTDTYEVNTYQDLLNVYYSLLDQGWDEFTFYCNKEYVGCINDVERISKDEVLLSSINNYIHPFNSYSEIRTVYDDLGEVTVLVTHLYNKEEIPKINYKLDEIFAKETNDNMDSFTKLRVLHDYIVNTTTYDITQAETKDSQYDSTKINGILFEGHGICSAYADLISVILSRLNIDNFKVSSSSHVWNAVFNGEKFLHLDATWDDPVSDSGIQTLSHDYYLISTEKLRNDNHDTKNEHTFDNKYYLYFQ